MRKEKKRVPRRRAPTRRMMTEKIMAPEKKEAMETRDLSQPHGLLAGWFEAPRPRKMVFPVGANLIRISCLLYVTGEGGGGTLIRVIPVCMPRKQDQALYALLSQRPVRKQSIRHTRSAWVGSRVCFHRRARVDSFGDSGVGLASRSGAAGDC